MSLDRSCAVAAVVLVGVTAAIATFMPAGGQVSATRWPPLPTVVQGLGGPITVRAVPNPKDEEGNELWGSWEQSTRLIEIDAGAPLEFQHHTLGHELCHAVFGDSGHEYLYEEKQIEALCDAFGSARVQEIRGRK